MSLREPMPHTRPRQWFAVILLALIATWSSPAIAQEDTTPPPPRFDFLKALLQLKLDWLKERKANELKVRDDAAKHAKVLKDGGGPQPGQTQEEYDNDVQQTQAKIKRANDAATEDQKHIEELSHKDAFDPSKDSAVAKRNGEYLKKNVDGWIRKLKEDIEKGGAKANAAKEQVKIFEDAEKEAAKAYPGVFPK